MVKDRNLLGSDVSVRGITADCDLNAHEVNSSTGARIKYLRIDYIGSGNPTNIGMGFDNFRAFGCTKDAKLVNAFTTGF
ncbi:hypothetical protein SARC_08771 [Sphaeroforma arctica JP610]|uniref:Uncharacterized protein n=1 Tax=Sphaeroforma arctica JP610 TaxID=667725 RepID=A0A0L0FPS4_9EUKA|nr:hypothetical protein SARC_08771 [Sphaeroforma arctica JP610]KNC78802.1 hypothetical protein SARC_08771 [Sphaeroforma arctica JP610]|eukprot:XP_014152704.1 hypothetical protein SARC_08771 [Sphaeroforma arctica JP610]